MGLRTQSPVLERCVAGSRGPTGLSRDTHQPVLCAEPDMSTGIWPTRGSGPSRGVDVKHPWCGPVPPFTGTPLPYCPRPTSGNSFSDGNVPPRRLSSDGTYEEAANAGDGRMAGTGDQRGSPRRGSLVGRPGLQTRAAWASGPARHLPVTVGEWLS